MIIGANLPQQCRWLIVHCTMKLAYRIVVFFIFNYKLTSNIDLKEATTPPIVGAKLK